METSRRPIRIDEHQNLFFLIQKCVCAALKKHSLSHRFSKSQKKIGVPRSFFWYGVHQIFFWIWDLNNNNNICVYTLIFYRGWAALSHLPIMHHKIATGDTNFPVFEQVFRHFRPHVVIK